MRKASHIGMMIAALGVTAGIGALGHDFARPLKDAVPGKQHDPHRLALAEAKRARKAAKRLSTQERT